MSKNNDLISIIVPVYNAEKYIEKTVDSILSQTYTNIEVILVNDGSTDSSPDICDLYSQKDSRVKVVHKENGGLVSAWKCGVLESSGRYLSFVDSDDWIDSDMVEKLNDYTDIDYKEIISSDYIIEKYVDGRFVSEPVYQSIEPGVYGRELIKEKIIPNALGNENRLITISRCMKIISRELIEDNMKYSDDSLRMAEDVSIIYPSILDAERICILDHKAFYHYLYTNDSMVHKYDRSLMRSIETLYDILNVIIKDKNLPILKEGIDKEFIFLLLLAVKNEVRGNKVSYKKEIKCIFQKYQTLIKNTKVTINSLSNKLLYNALKNPNWINIKILRLATVIYYR